MYPTALTNEPLGSAPDVETNLVFLLDEAIKQFFVAEYANDLTPETIWAARWEALGLLIAHISDWGLEDISKAVLKITAEALGDASFHSEASVFSSALDYVEAGELITDAIDQAHADTA